MYCKIVISTHNKMALKNPISRGHINNRKNGLEVYLPGATNRFVTVTGNVYRQEAVPHDDEALMNVLNTFMKRKSKTTSFKGTAVSYFTDEQLIAHSSNSTSGEKFKALYDGNWEGLYASPSEADMALTSMLCFWRGCVEEQIDRIFRTSERRECRLSGVC